MELEQGIEIAEEQQENAFRAAMFSRWEFGRIVLGERGDKKQLKKGRMAELCEMTGKSKPEISFRVQFAERCPTEAQVSNALDTFSSWREIVKSLSRKDEPEPEDDGVA